MIGRTLGHYEIIEPLGAGGMGEVYLARDTRLGRKVAIKVLPAEFASDPERLARFEREAKLLASLNHANIAAIYGLEDEGEQRFIVMEVVEGETLAERIAGSGRIEVEEALDITRQIAEALEAAHENGVIHRDLKPANIKITPDDQVKVLDFGLAKAFKDSGSGEDQGSAEGRGTDLTHSPTVTVEGTRTGVILGTAAYMSPEQTRGKPLDERTDIWSFGCVLYELLSGQRAFAGESVSDHVAKILEREPDWEALPRGTPTSVRTLLRRCLAKDPKWRMHDMGDVWLELMEVTEQAALEQPAQSPAAPWKRVLPWLTTVLCLALAAWLAMRPQPPVAGLGAVRFTPQTEPLALGAEPYSSIVELSPDGTLMAYLAGEGTIGQIYLQRLDSFESVPVEGAESARSPFFSPDGEWLGFEAEGELRKVPVEGGKAWPICTASNVHGATWLEDGTIIYGEPMSYSLRRVSAEGGEPETLLEADRSRGEGWVFYPHILPNGNDLLFTVLDAGASAVQVDLLSLRTGLRRTVMQGGSNIRYLPTGHLIYAVDGSLMAVPFDADRGEVTGSPFPVVDGVLMGFPWGPSFGHFTVAENGTLAFVSGPIIATVASLQRVDRDGRATPIGGQLERVQGPRFSPDGRRIAVSSQTGDLGSDLWVYDLERETFTRLTHERQAWFPLWTPDGQRLAFVSVTPEFMAQIFWMPTDGSGPPERLIQSDFPQQPNAWSPDGGTLILQQDYHPETKSDVLAFRPGEDSEARPILNLPFDEFLADLSPDGRWLAYSSNESGRVEVYVRSFPDLGGKVQISSDGGIEPAWSPDGTELFYRDEEGLRTMVVDIALEPGFSPGTPRLLFKGSFVPTPGFGRNYDVAPDGQSFVMVRQEMGGVGEAQLHVVLNWFEELKRLVPREQ